MSPSGAKKKPNMKRSAPLFLVITIAFSVPCFSSYIANAQSRRPNIVVIVADDMGYGDIGVHGSKDIPTPNIDSLAKHGIRFTDAYVSGPICSPTRAGLLTGRYPQRFGHEFNIGAMVEAHRKAGLSLEEITIADRLKSAGYRTALVGKWHLGTERQFWPDKRGFDEFFGFLSGSHRYSNPTPGTNPIFDINESGTKIVREISYLTDLFADRAVDFINRQKAQPFFLYVAFNAVHEPTEATDKYLARFPGITNLRRRTYAAVLSAMDDAVGRIAGSLRTRKLEENTLLIFLNDNGGPMSPAFWNGSSNFPLRGAKGDTWEGAIRVPFIISWKGHLPEGEIYSEPIIQLDVAPTALAAAGIQVQPEWRLDGVDLVPFLTRKVKGVPHEFLYWRTGGRMGIRHGDWKLVKSSDTDGHDVPSVLNELADAELYNLKNDISETKNLASKNPKKVQALKQAWQQWNKQLSTPGWPPVPPAAQQHLVGCVLGSEHYYVLKTDNGIFRLRTVNEKQLTENIGKVVDATVRSNGSKSDMDTDKEAAFAKQLGIHAPQTAVDVMMVTPLAQGCPSRQ
jgi:arylsulfatase A-like enzyme